MNAILGFSQLVKEKSIGNDEKIQSYTRIIHSNGHFLMQLIDDMIDLSKIEAGEIALKLEKFNLKDMFEELYAVYSRELIYAGKNDIVISWELKLPDDYIFSDKLRIRQIISNLLNNSLKFTSNGSIHFSARKEDGKVIFCVKDSGIGIPVENHSDVFKRFIKLTNDPNIKGTGIGLSIASDLVRLLGGKMGIKSQTGVGSEFEFYVPEVTIP
jgi:signal transduction histidine kinase